jgi:bifunctional non-homologous end joining protein LigD
MPTITPYKFFPTAKPPKKALNSHEVFSVQRLTDVLPKDVEQWIVSSKMDGIRCEATISDAQQAFYTDEGNKIDNKRLSHIVKELAGLRGAPNVFDGELMYSIDGKAQPHNLVAGFMNSGGDTRMDEQDNIFYVVFDLLYSDGKDLSGLPYKQRLELLSSLIKKYPPPFHSFIVHAHIKSRNALP